MITPEHSPLPWEVNPNYPGTIRDANGSAVAITSTLDYGDSHRIVAAVNSHAELAELLAASKALYQAVHGDTIAIGPLWGRLHAAIAAAEEVES